MSECPVCDASLVLDTQATARALLCGGCGSTLTADLTPMLPVATSRWASAAIYLGLLSMLPGLGLLALGVGAFALRDIRRHSHKRGLPAAIAGMALGAVSTLAYAALAALFTYAKWKKTSAGM